MSFPSATLTKPLTQTPSHAPSLGCHQPFPWSLSPHPLRGQIITQPLTCVPCHPIPHLDVTSLLPASSLSWIDAHLLAGSAPATHSSLLPGESSPCPLCLHLPCPTLPVKFFLFLPRPPSRQGSLVQVYSDFLPSRQAVQDNYL